MSGPTWLPPKQPEPSRVPQGRALPRGALGPPPAHGASKCSSLSHPGVAEEPLAGHSSSPFLPCPAASCCLFPKPEAPILVQPSLTPIHSQTPQVREGEAPRKGQPSGGTPSPFPRLFSLTALQPHPRVNFCPLPPEQCYQPPGVPDDRGPSWVGSHGAPQRLQVRLGGEGRVCGSLSRGEDERSPGVVVYICSPWFGSVFRGSRQTGASSALEAWMLRSIRSPACWRIWTEVAAILLGDQTDRSVSCVLFLLPRPQPVPFCGFSPQSPFPLPTHPPRN